MAASGAVNGSGKVHRRAAAPPSDLAALRVAASVIAHRAELAQAAGLSYGGKRDLYKALGYERDLTPKMYRERYERGGVAARLVDAYPKATWGAGGAVFDDEDPEVETKWERAFAEEAKRLKLWAVMLQLDICTRLGRFGALLVGTGDGFDGEANPASKVLYLKPLSEEYCRLGRDDLNKDEGSERFGQPEFYRVKLGNSSRETRIHHSHFVHSVEGALTDDVFGKPALRTPWNDLDDLDKLKGGGAEAGWRRARPIRHLDVDPDSMAGLSRAEIEEQKVMWSEQVDKVEHELSSWLKTSGADIKPLDGLPFPFSDNGKFVIALLAATENIPQRKLLGSGIGEMTGKMEDDSFNDAVAERRETIAEPRLRLVVDRLVAAGNLPQPKGGEYFVDWPEEEELDEAAKGALVAVIADANQKQMVATGEPVMTSNEMRDKYLGMEPLAEEDLPPEPTPEELAAEAAAAAAQGGGTPPPPTDAQRAAAGAEPAWKATHRVADAYAARLEPAFRAAFDRVRESVDLAALEAAATAGNRVLAEQLLSDAVRGFGEALDEELPRQAATIFAEASA